MQKRKRYKLHNPDLICRLFVIIFLNLLISWENLQDCSTTHLLGAL